MNEKQITYLLEMRKKLRQVIAANAQFIALWYNDVGVDLDMNDYLSKKYPFDKCFDEVNQDFIAFVENYECQLKQMGIIE